MPRPPFPLNWDSSEFTLKSKVGTFLLTLTLFCGTGIVGVAQALVSNIVNDQSGKRRSTTGHCRQKRKRYRRKGTEQKPKLETANQPQTTEMKRAGTSSVDLRDLPSTTPVKKERPQRPDPKIKRRVYKKPVVQKREM